MVDSRDVPSLWTKHRKIADGIASEYYFPGADWQDVRQEAYIGLWIAAGQWDEEKGASFKSFAHLVIRRRLSALVRMALAEKHRPLNESVRSGMNEDGEIVPIIDLVTGDPEPFDQIVAQERLRKMVDAISHLTDVERESLALMLNGVEYKGNKRVDNGIQRAKRKIDQLMGEW